jgi:diguanylate cyclase (GGDEF)-like protein
MSGSRRNLILTTLLVYFFSALLIGLTWYQASVRIARDYESELQSVWRESTSIVRSFEDHVRRILRNTEHGMGMISRKINETSNISEDELKEILQNIAYPSQVLSFSVFRPDGSQMATTSFLFRVPPALLASHIQYHNNQPKATLYIDRPIQNIRGKDYLIPVSRPVLNREGKFEALAFALIPSEAFSNFYRQIYLGHDKVVTMVGNDGIIRARQYQNQTSAGQDIRDSALFRTELSKAMAGRFLSTSSTDGVSRFFNYVSMLEYPIILLVGVTESDFLASYEERKVTYYSSSLTVSLLVFWFSVLLTWLMYRQHKTQLTLSENNELLSFLHVTSLDIMNRREVVDLLETIIRKGSEITGASSGTVLLFNEMKTERIRVVATGDASPLLGSVNKIDEGAAGEVWKTGGLVLINDYKKWSGRVEPAAGVAEAVVYFPLKSANEVVGVIGLWHTERGKKFSRKDVANIEQLANLASIAYETAYLYREAQKEINERKQAEERLQYQSFHDSLTGLYNRTYFEEEMRRLDLRRDGAVSLFVFDVDGLKLINDTLGHDKGDQLLHNAGRLLQTCFRDADVVARIGGDEYAALVPDTDESAAKLICERIHHLLADWNASNHEVLSLSVGFASSNHPDINMRELFKRADDSMYREKLHRRQSTRSAIVQTVMKLLEARDFITEGHADRMQDLVVLVGRDLGFSESRLADMRLFAQFHDVGKVGIPDRILLKAGPLDPDEKEEMRRHCEIGYRIAQSAPDLMPIAEWVLKHQEWWNGEGYPLGIIGEDIPLECRILSIVDAYDAMTSDRPYRKALEHSVAVAELRRCAGSQFDPALVERFIRLLNGKSIL